jgi:HlyD family secretion protein
MQAVQDAVEDETGYVLSLRRAELSSAEIALDNALKSRRDATLRAPFTGIVAQLNAKEGETLAENVQVAIEIFDSSVIELVGQINETDVQRVSEGDSAAVTLQALPGYDLTGDVTSISSGAEQREGIAAFTITIRITVPPDLTLREGMNATALMAVQREEDVLLLPVQAIYGTFLEPLVRVIDDGVVTNRPVTLGNSDNFWVVIESGVEEGEEVIMHVADSRSREFDEFE